MLSNNQGFLIAATGDRYIREAGPLLSSIRKFMPDTPIHLVSDERTNVPAGLFDSIDRFNIDKTETGLKHNGYLFRVLALARTPFENTINLDCDTIIGAPVHEIFHGLRRFDLMVSTAPTRVLSFGATAENLPTTGKGSLPIVPRINVGFVGFSRSAVDRGFFNLWRDLYLRGAKAASKAGRKLYGDQSVFRRLIWESDMNYQIMTPEYHLRTGRSCAVEGPVRMMHGRPKQGLQALMSHVNSIVDHRIYLPDAGLLIQEGSGFRLLPFPWLDSEDAPEFAASVF